MRGGVIHHASGVRPAKLLVVRGGLVRTVGGLAGFVVVTFLCGGFYILEDAFANPRDAGAAAVISGAFIITLAAMLLFFLIKPRKKPRATRHDRDGDSAAPSLRPFFNPAVVDVRQDHLRIDMAYSV